MWNSVQTYYCLAIFCSNLLSVEKYSFIELIPLTEETTYIFMKVKSAINEETKSHLTGSKSPTDKETES